jgi:hypothetical protein
MPASATNAFSLTPVTIAARMELGADNAGEWVFQLCHHRARKRVQLVRAVDRDQRDAGASTSTGR